MIYEFTCDCGKVTDEITFDRNLKQIICECGKIANRNEMPSTFGFNGRDLKALRLFNSKKA